MPLAILRRHQNKIDCAQLKMEDARVRPVRFSISILTYSALASAKRCIASVLAHSSDYELILTANGSPEAAAYFNSLANQHDNIRVVVTVRNEGFISPNRKAFEMANGEFLILLNDDATVCSGWLEKMHAEFEKHPTAAIVGTKDACCSIGDNMSGFVGKNYEYVEMSCAMVKVAVFENHLALFPPQLVGAYTEDQCASLTAREAGYTIHAADFKLQHERSMTSRTVPEVNGWITHNVAYMQKRWTHYLKVRRFDYPMVIRSGESCGNPMLKTSVLSAIHEAHPLSPLYIETESPELFTELSFITRAAHTIPVMPDELRFNLDDSPTQTKRSGKSLLPGNRIVKHDGPPTITMLYVFPLGTLEWQKMAFDFVESYLAHPPGYDHDTLIVCNGFVADERTRSIFRKLPQVRYVTHSNEGFDIGAYIAGAAQIQSDLVVLMGSNTFLTRQGWMKRFADAWKKFGPGMYGTFGSWEIIPHLCTTFLAVTPELLMRYPIKVSTKAERYDLEHGPNALWRMIHADEYPVKLVLFDGEFSWRDWRKPPEIYRRGSQSNCLGGFRITKDYANATPWYKQVVGSYSDTLSDPNFQP